MIFTTVPEPGRLIVAGVRRSAALGNVLPDDPSSKKRPVQARRTSGVTSSVSAAGTLLQVLRSRLAWRQSRRSFPAARAPKARARRRPPPAPEAIGASGWRRMNTVSRSITHTAGSIASRTIRTKSLDADQAGHVEAHTAEDDVVRSGPLPRPRPRSHPDPRPLEDASVSRYRQAPRRRGLPVRRSR